MAGTTISLPATLSDAADRVRAVRRRWHGWSAVALAAVALIALGLLERESDRFGLFVLFLGTSAVLTLVGLRSPVWAVFFLLIATFLRLGLPSILPVDLFLVAFAGVLGSVAIGIASRAIDLPRLGIVEAFMALYVMWNVGSMVVRHTYSATVPVTGADISVWRFILTGTVIPFVLYVVGRFVFDTERSIRMLLWLVLAVSAYSSAVSIMQFRGPTSLVWPRYIVENPGWPGRAVGVFNQPVVNGLVLIVGFIVAMFLAAQKSEPAWRRALIIVIAAAAAYGIYLTHTRAVWLAFALVLVGGAVFAKGVRSGFAIGVAVAALAVATNWSTFTSADRAAGGIASENELEDRLNAIATSLRAIREEPITGWGIGRFTAVNTYQHVQWSDQVPWIRGFGIASHLNELGIVAELGLIGLVLWLGLLGLVLVRLIRSHRVLPSDGLCSSRLALVATMCFLVLVVTGLTVDLRFFDFPNAIVMLLAGVTIGCAERASLRDETVAECARGEKEVSR